MDALRFNVGLLDMTDSARFLGIPRATFHRWARGYRASRNGVLLTAWTAPELRLKLAAERCK